MILCKSFMHKGMKVLLDTPARYETYRGGFSGFAHAADPFDEKRGVKTRSGKGENEIPDVPDEIL